MGLLSSILGGATTAAQLPGAIGDANQANQQNIANQQALAQTANQQIDTQQKQRGFQLSMLNGVMTLPEDKQADALSKIIPMFNRSGPIRVEPDTFTPATAKMLLMSNVPTEQVPQYQMIQSQAAFLNAVRNRLAGNNGQLQSGAIPDQASAPQSTVTPQNGILNGPAPIPQGGGQPIDQGTRDLLATVMPDVANSLTNIQRAQYESPQGQQQIAQGKKQGDNLADVQKTFNVAESALPRALERFEQIRNAALDASYGTGVNNKGEGWAPNFAKSSIGQFFEPNTATANQTIDQATSQGVLSELGPQMQGLKGNKFLEGIAAGASGLNHSDPPQTKVHAVDGLEAQYISNLKQLAAQRRAYGDNRAPTDEQIDAEVARLKSQKQSSPVSGSPKGGTPMPPLGARKAEDNNWYLPDPNRPGKYLQWRP